MNKYSGFWFEDQISFTHPNGAPGTLRACRSTKGPSEVRVEREQISGEWIVTTSDGQFVPLAASR
jgi:hypothetical protein